MRCRRIFVDGVDRSLTSGVGRSLVSGVGGIDGSYLGCILVDGVDGI